MKAVFIFLVALLSSLSLHANEFDFGLSYSYLRAESNQTGSPSEFLFDPALKAHLDYTFNVTETQVLSLGADYSMYKVDAANLAFYLGETDFKPLNYHGRYSMWIRHGFNFIVHGGQKEFPIYTLSNLIVDFAKFRPYYYGLGVAIRAKNSLGTLEVEYLFKYIPETELDGGSWTGNAQELKVHFNLGRKKNHSAKRPGFFGKVNFTHYKRAAIEGNYGIFFNYNFSHLTSDLNYDYKLDERIIGLYYKWRITNPYRRN